MTMAFNFAERLGSMLGRTVVERLRGTGQQAPAPEEAPAPEATAVEPAAEAVSAEASAPPEESYTAPAEVAAEPVATAEPSVAADPGVTSYAAATAPTAVPASPAVAADATLTTPAVDASTALPAAPDQIAPSVEPTADAGEVSFAPPTEAAAEAPAEPEKSAEELEEERLWGDVEAAWGAGDFQRVTDALDRLRELQPEDATVIDEKIAAAQYNQASSFEQAGDLERALYLYQEAQRRNPALGEAAFAIDRVQAAMQPPAAAEAAPEPAPAAPAEQSYTVADGDTLSAIAEQFYGAADQWPRIFEANRDQLDNPDLIYPGQVLRIPS
jgi:hypothetical protein